MSIRTSKAKRIHMNIPTMCRTNIMHGNIPGKPIPNVEGMQFDYPVRSGAAGYHRRRVAQGEILALGPNGVCKSTVLKCMNLILKPKTGTILLEEQDLTKMSGSEIARNLGGHVAQRNESAQMTDRL